ncbi:MAG: hypothetical protein Ct9H90mP16_17410 [Candidatus Poseidoniales archaeon]|nr:MAG: hypothetical protein Ct9H90mP16_17410 [Candidatus Poseidoniales archaeon]
MFRGKKKKSARMHWYGRYHLVMGDAANRANYEKAADKLGGVDCALSFGCNQWNTMVP